MSNSNSNNIELETTWGSIRVRLGFDWGIIGGSTEGSIRSLTGSTIVNITKLKLSVVAFAEGSSEACISVKRKGPTENWRPSLSE